MGTCPKCGAKLKKTDWRPNCWNCGVNIMYYGMEARLDEDAERAEKEFGKLYHMTAGIKTSFIGSKLAYARWILTLLCIGALFLPLVKINVTLPYHMVEGASYGILQTVMFVKDMDFGGVIAAFSSPVVGDTLIRLCAAVVCLAVGALMAVLNLILILRAYTKSGGILLAVRWGIGLGAMVAGTVLFQMAMKPEGLAGILSGQLSFGIYIALALFLIVFALQVAILSRGGIPMLPTKSGTGCRGGAAGVGKRAGCSWCLSGCRPQHDVGESRGFKMEAA